MMRLCFLDAPHGRGWRSTGALAELSAVAGELAARGHQVSVAAFAHWDLAHEHWPAEVERLVVPLIERPAIEVTNGVLGNGRTAYDALCAAQWLEKVGFDVVIAPEAGGLAAYAAMAAAASPEATAARMVLWATGGTRGRLRADRRPAGFADLVSDALEHSALKAADAVIVPHGQASAPARAKLTLPVLPLPVAALEHPPSQAAFSDIALIGGLEESGGTLGFLDAIERLQRQGLMDGRSITIAGPARQTGRGLSAVTLEVRARDWDFSWNLKPDLSARDTLALMVDPRRLSVFAGAEVSFPGLLAAAIDAGATVLAPRSRLTRALLQPDQQKGCLYAPVPGGLDRAVEPLLTGEPAPAPRLAVAETEAVTAWADALERLAASRRPTRRRRVPSVSVCVICRRHPQLLARALASIEAGSYDGKVEIILVDDAATPSAAYVIERESSLSGSIKSLKIIRNDVSKFPSGARNQAAAAAGGDCLVFLDDDNWLLEDGLARLAQSMASGAYDVVTAALEVDQPGLEDGRPPLRMTFLGDAGLAGLVYNGFGDASLIIRKEAFERAEGFPDEGVLAPAEDWVFLARCRAAGLRMASLWKPCFGYHKPVDLAQRRWRKSHKEGALARVREAYGRLEGDDLSLALAYLQGLEMTRQEA